MLQSTVPRCARLRRRRISIECAPDAQAQEWHDEQPDHPRHASEHRPQTALRHGRRRRIDIEGAPDEQAHHLGRLDQGGHGTYYINIISSRFPYNSA